MSPITDLLKRARRRRKARRSTPFLQSACTAFFWLLNAVVLFYAIENWRGTRRFAEVKQRLSQRGVSLDWKSYAPPAIPDEENVAMHPLLRPLCEYERIHTPHPKGGWTVSTRWLDSNGLKRLEAVHLPAGWWVDKRFKSIEPNRRHPVADLALWQTCFRHDTNFPSPLHPGTPANDVLLALTRFEPELRELHEALGRPSCRLRLPFDERPDEMQLWHLDVFKGLARVLRLRAAAQSAVGEGAAALADIEDILKLADCLKDEPLLIPFRTRAAVVLNAAYAIGDGLARQAWSDAQLLRLENLLAGQELLPGLELALNGETASALQAIDTIRADGGIVDGAKFESLRWVPRGWFDQNNAWLANHIHQHVTPALDSSTRRVFASKANAEAEALKARWLTPYSILALWWVPDTPYAVRRAAHAQTVSDQALLACALERHRLATGCVPDSLAALSPGYLSAMPRDVVSGAPLGYRPSPDGGFLLWSVGWNEKDEAGLVCRTQNGRLNIEEGDWVWERPTSRGR